MLWSILICSLEKRKKSLQALRAKLRSQIEGTGLIGRIEVLVSIDKGQMSIGEKRNRLMARAVGEYVCYVDDDDDVADTYVRDISAAMLRAHPDCVSFRGRILLKNGKWKDFCHALCHREYGETKREFTRPPNHLNPIRKAIAVRFPFAYKNWGEDTDYAMAILEANALKTEIFIDAPLYIYRPS